MHGVMSSLLSLSLVLSLPLAPSSCFLNVLRLSLGTFADVLIHYTKLQQHFIDTLHRPSPSPSARSTEGGSILWVVVGEEVRSEVSLCAACTQGTVHGAWARCAPCTVCTVCRGVHLWAMGRWGRPGRRSPEPPGANTEHGHGHGHPGPDGHADT